MSVHVCVSDDVSIHWRRTDDRNIPSDSRVERRDYNVRLQIGKLQRSDEGAYACTGSNTAGSAEFPLQLLVHGSDFATLVHEFVDNFFSVVWC